MRRRTLIAASAVCAANSVAGTALAAGPTGDGAPPAMSIAGVGLPVIVDGRLRNYVFVTLRLHLGAGQTPQSLRAREPWFRDALVRAGHRTPFVVADDWTRLDERALSGALMAACARIAGRGAVTRVEVVGQSPRRRTGVRAG